jgi:hypothetical protein
MPTLPLWKDAIAVRLLLIDLKSTVPMTPISDLKMRSVGKVT